MRRSLASAGLVLAAVLLIAALPACGGTTAPRGPSVSAAPPAAVGPMPNERRVAGLPEGFPREVPVASGEVVEAGAQGDSAWTYELRVAAPPRDVARWYAATYQGRSWTLTRDAMFDGPEGGGEQLVFLKGAGAQTELRITSDGAGGARVRASVGIGVGVTETY